MKELSAFIATAIAIGGYIPYLSDAYHKRVKPHPYTWLVWTIVTSITFFGQLAKGAGVGVLPTAVSGLFTLSIFLFSLRYGFRYISRTDTFFLVLALAGLIPWYISKDPTISVVVAVSIDVVAFIPTIRKTWQHPKSETPVLYSANVIKHIFALFSLQAYNIATMLHSITMIVSNSIMTGIILLKENSTMEKEAKAEDRYIS